MDENFQMFWDHYPRQIGKTAAKAKWDKLIDRVKPEDLISAAYNYARTCKIQQKEVRFILLPKTFLGPDCWYEDYIAGVPKSERPQFITQGTEKIPVKEEKYKDFYL